MGSSNGSHLDGRVVVITGAGSGFGELMAGMAAERGAKVVVADVDADNAGRVAKALRDAGGSAEEVVVDVRDLAAVQAMVARAVERFGAVDVLINNAGVMPLAFLADHAQAYEAWERCIDINFKGVLNGICAVHDQMIEQGRGHVVNISSIYANAGTAGSGVYSATKAAVAVLSNSLRVESQGKIKVTVVRPTGVLGTNLSSGVVNPAAAIGITGQHGEQFMERTMAYLTGGLDEALTDVDSPAYWAITPDVVAREVIHAIDQPWGVSIGDITIRARRRGLRALGEQQELDSRFRNPVRCQPCPREPTRRTRSSRPTRHAGGSHAEYREYLDPQWRDEFDAWRGQYKNPWKDLRNTDLRVRNWDDERRDADELTDGVVGEVLFPNTVPPFFPGFVLFAGPPKPRRTTSAGGPACRRTTVGWWTSAVACPSVVPASARCSSTTSTTPSRTSPGSRRTACAAASCCRPSHPT